MIKKAFDLLKERFETNRLSDCHYSWLSSISDYLGHYEFANEVRISRPDRTLEDNLYNRNNLISSKLNLDLIPL